MISQMRDMMLCIYKCMTETPWVFSEEIRKTETQLKLAMMDIEGVWSEVEPLLQQERIEDCDASQSVLALVGATRSFQSVVSSIHALAQAEYEPLVQEYDRFISEGITQ